MTDTESTVLRALDGVLPGRYVTVDTLRDHLDAAGLTSAEKSGGLRNACTQGYITGVFLSLPGFDVMYPIHAAVPSTHPAGKGRYVKLWRRTDKVIPEHLCGRD